MAGYPQRIIKYNRPLKNGNCTKNGRRILPSAVLAYTSVVKEVPPTDIYLSGDLLWGSLYLGELYFGSLEADVNCDILAGIVTEEENVGGSDALHISGGNAAVGKQLGL